MSKKNNKMAAAKARAEKAVQAKAKKAKAPRVRAWQIALLATEEGLAAARAVCPPSSIVKAERAKVMKRLPNGVRGLGVLAVVETHLYKKGTLKNISASEHQRIFERCKEVCPGISPSHVAWCYLYAASQIRQGVNFSKLMAEDANRAEHLRALKNVYKPRPRKAKPEAQEEGKAKAKRVAPGVVRRSSKKGKKRKARVAA